MSRAALLPLALGALLSINGAAPEDVVIGGVRLAPDPPPPPATSEATSAKGVQNDGSHAGHPVVDLGLNLRNRFPYSMLLRYCTDPRHSGKDKVRLSGFQDWSGGHSTFYCSGFLNVEVDGHNPTEWVVPTVRAWREGKAAFGEMVWDDSPTRLALTARADGGGDGLMLRFDFAGKTLFEKVSLWLGGYPGGFVDAPGEYPKNRVAVTAERRANVRTRGEGKGTKQLDPDVNWTLDPQKETWVFLGDDANDPELLPDRDGGGGIVYVPEDVKEVVIRLGSYGGGHTLACEGGGHRVVRLCMFKYYGRPNRVAVSRMRNQAAKVIEELRAWR